jgi:hypothetical protein
MRRRRVVAMLMAVDSVSGSVKTDWERGALEF